MTVNEIIAIHRKENKVDSDAWSNWHEMNRQRQTLIDKINQLELARSQRARS